ncbi:MAG: Rrf2 family transcriptional regulator [bacterium]|nr:Rrf2 family transcriptional regulator [bacterium]
MRISAKGEYAILAMLDLAQAYDSEEVRTLEEISNEQSVPHPFLVQILLELKRSGLVESRRGAGGGYRLARHPRDISLGEVIRLIDGPLLPFKCNENGHHDGEGGCAHKTGCVLRSVWTDVRDAIERVIDDVSFEELARRQENMNSPMYYI